MSWEVMQTTSGPCACGAGTETYTLEMDDWNRTRSATEFRCPMCSNKREQEVEVDRKHDKRRARLVRRAQELVTEQYRARWLELFAGMTRKAACRHIPEVRVSGPRILCCRSPAFLRRREVFLLPIQGGWRAEPASAVGHDCTWSLRLRA